MNTYIFFYQVEHLGRRIELQWRVKARRLSQALTNFYIDSKSFNLPVTYFLPRYEVLNSEGKWSSRLLSSKIISESPFSEFKNEN